MIDTFYKILFGFVLGQLTASTIILILETKHKERREWEGWKNKLP